jgi:hypothetical protein
MMDLEALACGAQLLVVVVIGQKSIAPALLLQPAECWADLGTL